MALKNIAEESDVEIIPSSCPFSEKTEQELTFPLHHRRNLIGLNVQSPSVRVAESYCYVNSLPRNRRRLKKKPFGFVSELSQKLSPSQEHEFWSPSKLNGDLSSKYNNSFNKEKISKANTSDSFVYNINKSCSPNNVTNCSLPCLSLSPYNEKRGSEVVNRQIFTNAANLVSDAAKIPKNLLGNANKLNSIHSPSRMHSNSSVQNSNVIEESELILSADFFASNQLSVPITEGLHPLKRKLSESLEKGENKKKEAMVNNGNAMSSTKISEGESPGVCCNEIGGLIQRQTNGTIDDFANGAVGDRSLSESHSSPEKVCGCESSSNKKEAKEMNVGISTEGLSNTKNVIGSDSPRKLRDKKLDVETSNGGHEKWSPKKKQRTKKLEQEALTDGIYNSENTLHVSPTKSKQTKKLEVVIIDDDFAPEKVSGCDSSLKKLNNEILLNETSIEYTPERITGHESPKKKRGTNNLDNVVLTDERSNPVLITGYESSTEIQQPNKLKVGISTVGHSISENAIERESSPPILRNKKFVYDTLKDGHSNPKNITSHKSSSINLKTKKLEYTTSMKLLSSPEKVTGCGISPKKLQKITWLDETLSDGGRSSPAKVSRYDSSLEKYRNKKSVDEALSNRYSSREQGSESRTKGHQTKKLKDRKSIDDHSSKVKVTGRFSSPKKVGNEKLLEELSSDESNLKNRTFKNLFSPEKVGEFASPSKKQRKKNVSTDDLSNQQITTGGDDRSSVEKYKNYKPPVNEGNTVSKDEGSKDDEVGAKINSECELPDSDTNKHNTCNDAIRKEYKKRLKNKRSIDRHFNKEIINDSECSTNKKRCSDLEDSDCHVKPPESDRIKKERRRKNSKTSMSTSSDALSKSIGNESNKNEELVKVKRKKIKKDGHSRSNSPSTAKNGEGCETSVFRFNLQLDDIPLTDKEIRMLHKKLIKTYVLPEELCAKLQKLQIKITWKLSPFHEDYAFLHNGEYSYADKCSLSNTNLMEGPFEIEENEAIVNQWKTFCKMYGFNSSKDFRGFLPRSYDLKRPSPLPKRQKLKFVQFLAKDLPDRLLHTVYARFIAMFKHYCKGRFKSEEDELLLIFKKYSNNKRIYSILSSILHRSRFTIYRRMKRLSEFYGEDLDGISLGEKSSNTKEDKSNCGENELRVPKCSSRTREITKSLRKTISHLTGSEDVQKWDSFSANNSSWYRVGKKCKITPVEAKLQYLCNLRVKSLLHTIPRTSSLLMRIIQKLKEHHWKKWKHISWNLISEELSQLGSVFLYLTFRRYVKKNVPSEFWGKYTDCLDYIEQNNLDVDSKDLSEHR